MKITHQVLSAGVAGLSLLAAASATAAPVTSGFNYQDIIVYNSTVTSGHNLQGTFNITDNGSTSFTVGSGFSNAGTTFHDLATFDNSLQSISSASVYFYVENANSANDLLTINLTDDSGFFSGKAGNANYIIGDSLNSAAVTFLNNNGTLSFTISNTGTSDFKVDAAQLQVFTQAKSNDRTVPDGGSTVALLGTGLLGCALLTARRHVLKPVPVKR